MSPSKRKKVRISLRKKAQKRARRHILTREIVEEDLGREDLLSEERVSGKGELTRRRTVIVETNAAGEPPVLEVDEAQCLRGRVLWATGLTTTVQAEDGTRYACAVRRLLLKLAGDARSAVVAGDRVHFQPTEPGQGVIQRVAPRRGVIARRSQAREHVLVANVDQVLIVVSAADPPLKPGLIDRFLISAEKGGVRSVICINKADLVDPAALQPIAGLYGRLGYDVLLTSGIRAIGLKRLRGLLQGRQTAVAGQSGVGKSSLLNALQPGLALRTAAVAESTGKGRHTTRRAELMELEFGGWVVDTPGIRQLGLWDVLPEEVEGFFVEFRPFVTRCRFPDCTHTHESGCGIKRAVEGDLISTLRYESYLRIISGEPE